MDNALALSDASRVLAGILLVTVVAVESGGLFMLALVRGQIPKTDFQKSFSRAGHAHAGVLVTLGLVCQLFVDSAGLEGVMEAVARQGVPLAAILMPAGFFFSSMGRATEHPNGLIALVYAGAASLALGVLALGIGLLTV
ncbi:MAG: hypothetical protein GEU71_13415 [Actinobacteria bacterium]|nr:hypothetical protein [Actinomycetota bacterium]